MDTHPSPKYPALARKTHIVISPRLNGMRSPKGVFKGTREEWLEASALIMGSWINDALEQEGRTTYNRKKDSTKYVPTTANLKTYLAKNYGGKPKEYTFQANTIRYATSLMGGSDFNASGALAHCHFMHATGNGYHEIRMGVHVGGRKTKDESSRVADILLHEILHTCNPRAGHKGSFAIMARTMGLEGSLTATVASDELRTKIWDEVVTYLGKYPHDAVTLVPRGKRGKGSRSIKVQCPRCEFVMRTTRLWIDKAEGHLVCPIGCMEKGLVSCSVRPDNGHYKIGMKMIIFGYDGFYDEYKNKGSEE